MRFCLDGLAVDGEGYAEGQIVADFEHVVGEERVEFQGCVVVFYGGGVDVVVLDPEGIVVGDGADWRLVGWSN